MNAINHSNQRWCALLNLTEHLPPSEPVTRQRERAMRQFRADLDVIREGFRCS